MAGPEMDSEKSQCILFDWGDTVMRNFPDFNGPMHVWPTVEAVPGIASALEILRPSSTIALATNAVDSDEVDIRAALDRCGLSGFFNRVFCFRDLGRRKPEPAFYLSILEALQASATSVFMVGDAFDDDVRAATAVGMSAVWFNPSSRESSSGPRHRTIHDHSELPAALEDLGASIRPLGACSA